MIISWRQKPPISGNRTVIAIFLCLKVSTGCVVVNTISFLDDCVGDEYNTRKGNKSARLIVGSEPRGRPFGLISENSIRKLIMTIQSSIQSFNFQNQSVRTIADEKGEFWFLANDVCGVLGYVNPRDAVSKHCKLKGVAKRDTPTESGNQEMTYINEPNLYRLIIKSRKPEAEAFEEWVMEDVLPTIRKTGQYISSSLKTQTALPNGLTLEQQDEIKKFHRELVQAAPKEKQAKLAIQLWSCIKSKFGVSYKEVAPEHYPEVLSLMARVAVENATLTGELLDKPKSSVLSDELVLSIGRVLLHAQDMRLFVNRYLPAFECLGITNHGALWSYVHDTEPTFKRVREFFLQQTPYKNHHLFADDSEWVRRKVIATAKTH